MAVQCRFERSTRQDKIKAHISFNKYNYNSFLSYFYYLNKFILESRYNKLFLKNFRICNY